MTWHKISTDSITFKFPSFWKTGYNHSKNDSRNDWDLKTHVKSLNKIVSWEVSEKKTIIDYS